MELSDIVHSSSSHYDPPSPSPKEISWFSSVAISIYESTSSTFDHITKELCTTRNTNSGVFLAMLIQLMNATKELKRISQKLSNFDFGARIGLWLLFLQCVRDWLILLYNGF
ncbi:hypothetical protein P8452_03032 [Trifolium repens]|nr:hypothetical protein P8452_03032 [Trifolium repens]